MNAWKSVLCLCLATGLSLWLTGCPATPTSAPGSGTDDHGHNHDGHEHGEDEHAHHHHGPHNGHIGVIGDEEYHVEWTHEGEKVSFYILDAEAKQEVPIEAEHLTLEVKIGDQEPTTYELAAVEPQEGKSAQFMVEDVNLEGALDALSENVIVTIKDLTINGKSFGDVKVEEHEHGHDHAHEGGEHKH